MQKWRERERERERERGREKIFKPTIVNESLHHYSNDNGVRKFNFATSKNLVVKSTMFPPPNHS